MMRRLKNVKGSSVTLFSLFKVKRLSFFMKCHLKPVAYGLFGQGRKNWDSAHCYNFEMLNCDSPPPFFEVNRNLKK